MKKKGLALVLAFTLLVVGVVTGTLAWLTAKSDTVTNTFTSSDITVKLEETTGTEYKMVPGYEIPKNPKAWVVNGSEECYLFVKLEMANNTYGTGNEAVNYLSYTIGDDWKALEGNTGVFYRTVTSTQMGEANKFSVLKDDKVTVSDKVTKEMMNALDAEGAAKPTLTVTVYASQLHKNATETFDAATAWGNIANK